MGLHTTAARVLLLLLVGSARFCLAGEPEADLPSLGGSDVPPHQGQPAAAARAALQAPPPPPSPPSLEELLAPDESDWRSSVDNDTMASFLEHAATPTGVMIFTTFTLGSKGRKAEERTIAMLLNFAYWLQERGLLQHTLLLTTDESSWARMRAQGLPATWDRCLTWRRAAEQQGHNQVFDIQKHWWAMKALEHGHKVLYMDSDNVVLGDVLSAFDPAWDVQGLSDWPGQLLHSGGALMANPCGMYCMVHEPLAQTGSELRSCATAAKEGHTPESAIQVATPCQSTGLWLLQPTPMAIEFMRALTRRIMHDAPWQWEQAAWNDVLLTGFLWAMGDAPPLRYRVLPLDKFSNIPTLVTRKARGLPADNFVVHGGKIHGNDKLGGFQQLDLWHPERFALRQESVSPGFPLLLGAARWTVPCTAVAVVVAAAAAARWARQQRKLSDWLKVPTSGVWHHP